MALGSLREADKSYHRPSRDDAPGPALAPRGQGARHRCYSASVATDLTVTVGPASRLTGRIAVPGDKSISHRALLLAALAAGVSTLGGLGPGDDCRSTRACLAALGIEFEDLPDGRVRVRGRGTGRLTPPGRDLDAGNSGTTTRLLMGVLAGHAWPSRLTGDASLRNRPMRRIIEPLELMGATVASAGGTLPVDITGAVLQSIDYRMAVASAQVKSGIMLAALHAHGTTVVREPAPTRDHTERALRQFGGTCTIEADGSIHVPGPQQLEPADVTVPGDPSSAAFWAAAAAAIPGSDVVIEHVSLNPSRLGFVAVLRRAGAVIDVEADDGGAEPAGSLRVRFGGLRPVVVAPEEVPGVIDELPVLAAMATHGGGIAVTGAGELRVKESDRIADLARGLRALGAAVDESADGFTVDGRRRLRGGTADAAGDHRLAMSFAIAALGAHRSSQILGAEAVSVSYPAFFQTLEALRG